MLYAASEGDANMLYATGFFVPDPFIFFEHKNHRHIVMSDLEIDRAKKQAHADRVLSLSLYQKKLRKLGKAPAAMIDIVDLIFRERGIRSLIVPANFSALLVRPTACQRLQRADQARPLLAPARDQEQS